MSKSQGIAQTETYTKPSLSIQVKGISYIIKRIIDILAGFAGCLLLVPLYFYVRHKNHQEGDFDPIFQTEAHWEKWYII